MIKILLHDIHTKQSLSTLIFFLIINPRMFSTYRCINYVQMCETQPYVGINESTVSFIHLLIHNLLRN